MDSIVALNKPVVEGRVVSRISHEMSDQFEENRWLYWLFSPLCYLIATWAMLKKGVYKVLHLNPPRVNSFFADGISDECMEVRRNATSWRALERVYNYQFGTTPGLKGTIEDFWEGSLNPQALRNRLKVAKRELRKAISKFPGQEVRIMSLAAGSARGVIEVVAEYKRQGVRVVSLLVDIDPTALTYAQDLARSLGVEDQVQVTATNANFVAKVARRFQPHIIEMMGLLDYLPQKNAIKLGQKIMESLPSGGIFMTCNVYPNVERYFLRWVLDWPMIYRNPETLADVVVSAGFAEHYITTEPLNIHGVVVARKA